MQKMRWKERGTGVERRTIIFILRKGITNPIHSPIKQSHKQKLSTMERNLTNRPTAVQVLSNSSAITTTPSTSSGHAERLNSRIPVKITSVVSSSGASTAAATIQHRGLHDSVEYTLTFNYNASFIRSVYLNGQPLSLASSTPPLLSPISSLVDGAVPRELQTEQDLRTTYEEHCRGYFYSGTFLPSSQKVLTCKDVKTLYTIYKLYQPRDGRLDSVTSTNCNRMASKLRHRHTLLIKDIAMFTGSSSVVGSYAITLKRHTHILHSNSCSAYVYDVTEQITSMSPEHLAFVPLNLSRMSPLLQISAQRDKGFLYLLRSRSRNSESVKYPDADNNGWREDGQRENQLVACYQLSGDVKTKLRFRAPHITKVYSVASNINPLFPISIALCRDDLTCFNE